jgi:hypothetical protein
MPGEVLESTHPSLLLLQRGGRLTPCSFHVPSRPRDAEVEGVRELPLRGQGVRVRFALFDVPFSEAVTCRVKVEPTRLVFTVKLTELAPAGTVTVAGTVIALLPEFTLMVTPPFGAGLVIVRVPVEACPP